jgi:hypothetical protein
MSSGRLHTRQVRSDSFVGREGYIQKALEIFQWSSPVRILNIHSNGNGGLGKTQLLLHIQKKLPKGVIAGELIDFYDNKTRSRIGVMSQIALNIGDSSNFVRFHQLVNTYHDVSDISKRKEILEQLKDVFLHEYAACAKSAKKILLLAFDTYEVIQGQQLPVDDAVEAETTDFSHWLEHSLLPHLVQHENTRVIISGRFPIHADQEFEPYLLRDALVPFTIAETLEFWKKCLDMQKDAPDDVVVNAFQLDRREQLEFIHELAENGRPILLALLVDWVLYKDANGDFFPKNIIDELENLPAGEAKALFIERLFERFQDLSHPRDRVLRYMTIAYHRMDSSLLFYLLGEWEFEGRNFSSPDDYQEILDSLQFLSFIKPKGDNVIILHDEMRQMLVGRWWNEQDTSWSQRKDISKKLVAYYEEELLATDDIAEESRKIYTSELLEYALLADMKDGLNRFRSESDIALEDKDEDYFEFLLYEFERIRRERSGNETIPFPDFLEAERRRIQRSTEIRGTYKESLQTLDEILNKYAEKPVKEWRDMRGFLWLEEGIARFYSGKQFPQAIDCFEQAFSIFRKTGQHYWCQRADIWIGYAYYRQGIFTEARDYLERSRKAIFNLLPQEEQTSSRELRWLLQGFQLALGNAAIVYNYTEHSEHAIRAAEIVLGIARELPRNIGEIARARATVARTFSFAGRTIDANHHLKEAQKLLQEQKKPDRLISGRIYTDLGFVQYRVGELAHILEYYRAKDIETVSTQYETTVKIRRAEAYLKKAISVLEGSTYYKELADAYYALGELYIISPDKEHWQKSRQAFLLSLRWSRKSQFRYLVADTLESLVTLYYFWNGNPALLSSERKKIQSKIFYYQRIFENSKEFNATTYPDVCAKYFITCGDIRFDDALKRMPQDPMKVCEELKKAFHYYITALHLSEGRYSDWYYQILRIFYNRLETVIEQQRFNGIHEEEALRQLDIVKEEWQGESETAMRLQKLDSYIRLRLTPEKVLAGIQTLQQEIQQALDQGNLGWTLLLNESLIALYDFILPMNAKEDSLQERLHREQWILYQVTQSGFYRMIRDEYHAEQILKAARTKIEGIGDSVIRKGIEGAIEVFEATLKYRRGEYGQLLEFYLDDQLEVARDKFDEQFKEEANKEGNVREQAAKLFQESIKKLTQILNYLQESDERIRTYQRLLSEAHFRLGELMILNEQFTKDENYQKQTLQAFLNAEHIAKVCGHKFRKDDARQSLVNALYFAKKYDHAEYVETRDEYIAQIEHNYKTSSPPYHSIMGKLRIVQGDALFSKNFILESITLKSGEKEYRYRKCSEELDEWELDRDAGFLYRCLSLHVTA